MALIDGIIPKQNYELIGDVLGAILDVELRNQGSLYSPNEVFITSVYRERFVPPDETEYPMLNVVLADGLYDNKDQTQADGSYKYIVMAYASAKTTASYRGDLLASIKLQRLLGLCRAILENPVYNTLGFPKPTNQVPSVNIKNTRVGAIRIQNPQDNDATHSIEGFLEFYVKVPETVNLKDVIPLASSTTEVKLYLTDKGYRYGPVGGELDFFIAENSTEDNPIYFIAE